MRILSICTSIIFCLLLTACVTSETINNKHKVVDPTAAANANINLGLQLLKNKKVAQAKATLLKAVKEAPNLSASWYAMGYFMEVTGNEILANQYYLRAVKLDPISGASRNNYGTFLCRHKHYKAAVKEFIKATKDIAYLQTASAYENAGLCSMLIPDYGNAISYFKKAIQNDPNRRTSWLELARIYYQKNNLKQAKRYFTEYAIMTDTSPGQFKKLMLTP
ncbi:MAG: type IV pilus biogenesis/stability protein PilW [Gammaproteobacteria bacterium]|nr:type IV pilus biogenesis/stability protein PilW [Gammaproteobacteria bacterium]